MSEIRRFVRDIGYTFTRPEIYLGLVALAFVGGLAHQNGIFTDLGRITGVAIDQIFGE